jgi:phosphoesterase RecJ-like protein
MAEGGEILMTPIEAAEFLRTHDRYLILTHIRPDGDTLGCAAGLCRMLRAMGKEAAVLPNEATSDGYALYMTGLWASEDYEPETAVSVDVADVSMFTENATLYREKVDLAIDHHVSGGQFGHQRCVYPERAACGEIIYEIAVALGQLTAEVALPLYVAVSTDTGCFAKPNTTGDTLSVAAELIRTGIDFRTVNKRHFFTKTKRRIVMEGELLSNLEFFAEDHGVFITIPLSMINRLRLDEDDLDNVSSLGAQIEGVDCSITLREQPSGDWKASVRTSPRVNAAELCRRFGGGGHAEAAGCILKGLSLAQARTGLREFSEQLMGL